ncbi:MAG: FliM/FliN family flagellar motor switch protein [Acidobacteriales bacterium]|nr:FliM/FliN family flagellar motor switch protein [Terriglobales bacterium]
MSSPFGILGELEVNVEICFGSTEISLEHLLQLGPGAVIVLDQEIDQPVELLVEGKPFARGHVVMIDGCYGFEVTELIERPQ